MTINKKKLHESILALEHAIKFEDKIDNDSFYFAGISKSFEICLEYAWKYFKQKVTEAGLDAYSPRDAIKHAGRMGLLKNVEQWFDFLDDRNQAVHDYMGVSQKDYLDTIKAFLCEVKKIS